MDESKKLVKEIIDNDKKTLDIINKLFRYEKKDGRTIPFRYRIIVGAYNNETNKFDAFHYDDGFSKWFIGVLKYYADKGIFSHSKIGNMGDKENASKINNDRIQKLLNKLLRLRDNDWKK